MKMRASGLVAAAVSSAALCGAAGAAQAQVPKTAAAKGGAAKCVRAVLEGGVNEGRSFERAFAPGLSFKLEAIASGWIVRVLPSGQPRAAHDYAELATPPYNSVTPLAVSTDFSFRAQDAVGWNPRRFRFAATAEDFGRMAALYGPAMDGDGARASALAVLAAHQPEAQLTLLDAHLVPGSADQAQMAATVASHFATTPHTVDQSGSPSPLGKLTWIRFRVTFDLPAGTHSLDGVTTEPVTCAAEPTMRKGAASH